MAEITFGVPADQKVITAEILYNAFQDKFETVFGPKDRVISLLSEHFCNERIVVAHDTGEVIGVGGLKFAGKSFISITGWQLLRTLKGGIIRFLFTGWVLETTVEPTEILVDILAVTQLMRGKGIGSALMSFIIDFAHTEGYKQVKLFVVDTNRKAKKFYTDMGFKEKEIHRIIFPWNRVFGFNTAFEMVYNTDI
ncbi:MAG: GNAT family N-acetyltransferase [Candidatus Methanofastidiosia archaeon]|jgi:GNAT superfamily N-acetyltransferase